MINKILRLSERLENCWDNGRERDQLLTQWKELWSRLERRGSHWAALAQKAQAARLQKPQDLMPFVVALERRQGPGPKDHQFLVTCEDTPHPKEASPLPLALIAHNFRSAFNIGSLFRLADAFHLEALYLTGFSATPDHPQVKKTALGAEGLVPWHQQNSLACVHGQLRERGMPIVALETSPQAIALEQTLFAGPCAFLLGNERYGLSQQELAMADEVVAISLRGRKNSLNVAQAASIAVYEFTRQCSRGQGGKD